MRVLLALSLMLVLAVAPATADAATFTVDDEDVVSATAADAIVGDGICEALAAGTQCTLRAAIQEANFTPAAADTILFDVAIANLNVSGADLLPAITGPVTIDAAAQCGAIPCVDLSHGNGGLGNGSGLSISAGPTTIRGLAITGFAVGLNVTGAASGITIAQNRLGIDIAGVVGTNNNGIAIGPAASDIVVGGPTLDDGNVIAANGVLGPNAGGGLSYTGTGQITVQNNSFGLDAAGVAGAPNVLYNLRVTGSAATGAVIADNTFGAPVGDGSTANGEGLRIQGGGAVVTGNVVRRAPTIAAGLPPGFNPGFFLPGLLILNSGASGTVVGGSSGAAFPDPCGLACNDLQGTLGSGPGILIRGADDVTVSGNRIVGPGASVPAGAAGVRVEAVGATRSQRVAIGGDDPLTQNHIAAQTGPAIQVAAGATEGTGVEVLENTGVGNNAGTGLELVPPAWTFTDLLNPAGPGITGTTTNGGAKPPVLGQVATIGVGGTATPGAIVRVAQRAVDGFFSPTDVATATAGADGRWRVLFLAPVAEGLELTASQTTATGTSEFAAFQGAVVDAAPPVVTLTDGPPASGTGTSASFGFTSRPGATFECSLDSAGFAPCAAPFILSGVGVGQHALRVRATDLLGRVGESASRSWTVEAPPVPPVPAPVITPAAKPTVALPSNRACRSRRTLRLRIAIPAGASVRFAEVRVTGQRTRTLRGRAITAPVDLRGLPKARYAVEVLLTLADGKTISVRRTYKTCAPKPKAKPKA